MKCHMCGKELLQENTVIKEDFIFIEKDWGYFSNKDGQTHTFCLCENCYDRLVQSFQIPVNIEDTVELL